jgi:putative thioredoxin
MNDMSSPYIVDVDESDFDYQVLAYSQQKPVIVDFWAAWCDPCQQITPLLERLTQESQGKFRLAKVNVDENSELAKRYQVHKLPAIKAFQNGQVIGELRGVQTSTQIRTFVRQIVPSPDDLLVDKAQSLFRKEEYTASEKTSREILKNQPNHPEAKLLLVKSMLAQGESSEAHFLLKHFPTSPEYKSAERLIPLAETMEERSGEAIPPEAGIDAVHQRAIRLITMGNYPAALDGLLEVLRKNKRYKDGKAKEVVLGIFELLGEHHPLTEEYRPQLANILF